VPFESGSIEKSDLKNLNDDIVEPVGDQGHSKEGSGAEGIENRAEDLETLSFVCIRNRESDFIGQFPYCYSPRHPLSISVTNEPMV
jgi:hypothetical protein